MQRGAHEVVRERSHTFDSPYKFQRWDGAKLHGL
jgi:hypothetical protein